MATSRRREAPSEPLVLLVGEGVLVDREAHAMLGDTPYETVRPLEDGLLRAIDLLSQSSLFSSTTTVWIRGIRTEPEADIDEFLEFLVSGIPDDARLIASAAKIDKRTRLYKFFHKHGVIDELRPELTREGRISERDVVGYTGARVARAGLPPFPRAALAEIAKRVGADLGELFQEVDKLCLCHSEDQPLTLRAVREVMIDHAGAWIFDLTDALAKRDHVAAVQVVSSLLEAGEVPFRITATLTTKVATLLDACRAGQTLGGVWPGGEPQGFLNRMYPRLPESARRRFPANWPTYYAFREASAFKPAELRRLHGGLLRLDRMLKSSSVPPLEAIAAVLEEACIGG